MAYISYTQYELLLHIEHQNEILQTQLLLYDKQLELLNSRLEVIEKTLLPIQNTTANKSLLEQIFPYEHEFLSSNPFIGQLGLRCIEIVMSNIILLILVKKFRDGGGFE
jgi:hypothetical protein